MRILLLEDSATDAELIEYELRASIADSVLKRVENEEDFLKELLQFSPDLILSDYDLPFYNGALALAESRKLCPDVPFILVTGAVSEDRAIEILTSGAKDYVLKSRLHQRLVPAVQRALAEAQEHRARKKAEEELREAHKTLEREVEKRTAELQEEMAERKRGLEELKESEERFRSAFEDGAVPMALTALDGTMMAVNTVFAGMLGYSASELTGMKFKDITHPDDIAENEAGIASVMSGETRSFRMEKRYVRKNGRIVWVDMSTSAVCDARGKPIYFVTHAQDITERKQAEEAVRQSEERLKKTQEMAHLGSWELDLVHNRLSWSDEVYRIFGLEPQEFGATYEAFLEAVHPEDRASVDAAYTGSLHEGRRSCEIEHRVMRKSDSVIRVVHEKCEHCRDEAGRITRSIGMVHDITERRQLEHRQNLAAEVLGIFKDPSSLADSIDRILASIKRETHSEAVGIRLRRENDFPYFKHDGFSEDFLLTENTLVTRDKNGGICRDENGNVSLECMCGLVISGRTDPTNPLFTPNGSFWTNDSLPLLDLPADEDPRLHPRNRCIHEGFLSVALIPILRNREIAGLLQLNGRKKGCFTLDMVHFLEGIGSSIGMVLMPRLAQEAMCEN